MTAAEVDGLSDALANAVVAKAYLEGPNDPREAAKIMGEVAARLRAILLPHKPGV